MSGRFAVVAILVFAGIAAADEPLTPIPVLTEADRAAARAPTSGHEFRDSDIHSYLLLDQFEYSNGDSNGLKWEASGWLGADLDRLWLRTKGYRADGRFQSSDAEVFYGHSIATWWDVVAGMREDFKPGDARTWAAFGVQGLAPQWFELAATGYVGNGRTAARLQAHYQLLFTNRLILEPVVDVWLYGKDDAAHGIASGLSTGEFGLRLRYEFTRQFAPYAGVEHERAFGDTAALRRAAGADVGDTRLVLGLRTWF